MKRSAILLCVLFMVTSCGPVEDDDASQDRVITIYQFTLPPEDARLVPVEVEVPDTGDAAVDAVTALLSTDATNDSRANLWFGGLDIQCAAGPAVNSVTVTSDLVTVDLQDYDSDEVGNAVCDLSGLSFNVMIQQMVRTVQEATDTNAPVKIVVGGDYTYAEAAAADPTLVTPSQ
jgi:Sporulation and spore germination